jgi:hypothetical protein
LTIEQIPQLGGETGTRTRSALVGYTLYFANILEISFKNRWLISFSSDRMNIRVNDGGLETKTAKDDTQLSAIKRHWAVKEDRSWWFCGD